jgi:hypothetical protein|tara:strand:- start:99 stop:329 length:231 start_codon:yes stop_codon:yes gene_type:complete
MLLTGYKSRKELATCIGQPLQYAETSLFGNEYLSNGTFLAMHRPALKEYDGITLPKGREFGARITMVNDLIAEVTG